MAQLSHNDHMISEGGHVPPRLWDASDQAMVDEVTQEVMNEEAEWEERLTRDDITLRQFSLSKVSYFQMSISCF